MFEKDFPLIIKVALFNPNGMVVGGASVLINVERGLVLDGTKPRHHTRFAAFSIPRVRVGLGN